MNKTWTLPKESRKSQPSRSCVHGWLKIPMHAKNTKEKRWCDSWNLPTVCIVTLILVIHVVTWDMSLPNHVHLSIYEIDIMNAMICIESASIRSVRAMWLSRVAKSTSATKMAKEKNMPHQQAGDVTALSSPMQNWIRHQWITYWNEVFLLEIWNSAIKWSKPFGFRLPLMLKVRFCLPPAPCGLEASPWLVKIKAIERKTNSLRNCFAGEINRGFWSSLTIQQGARVLLNGGTLSRSVSWRTMAVATFFLHRRITVNIHICYYMSLS